MSNNFKMLKHNEKIKYPYNRGNPVGGGLVQPNFIFH